MTQAFVADLTPPEAFARGRVAQVAVVRVEAGLFGHKDGRSGDEGWKQEEEEEPHVLAH